LKGAKVVASKSVTIKTDRNKDFDEFLMISKDTKKQEYPLDFFSLTPDRILNYTSINM
jgi:hypothetical protein